MVANDLIWTLVRNNSCFIKKQKHVPVFSSEKKNMAGLNSKKYSGLAGGVGMNIAKNGDKERIVAVYTQKKGSRAQKPAKATLTTDVKKNGAKASKQMEKFLTKAGRRDLIAPAAAKQAAIARSFKKAKEQLKTRRNR